MKEEARVNWLDGLMSTVQASISGNPYRDDPDNVFNDQWDNIEIDTCIAHDTGAWETGICRDGEHFSIVEQYPDRDTALAGHARWVTALQADPVQELPYLMFWD